LCLIFSLVGSVLVGDWQSIGHDPCSTTALNNSVTIEAYISKSTVSSGIGDMVSNGTSTDIEAYISESGVSSGVGDMQSNNTSR
jgi:hypothetical protein